MLGGAMHGKNSQPKGRGSQRSAATATGEARHPHSDSQDHLSGLQPVGQNLQSQGLRTGNRVLLAISVDHNPGEFKYLGDPTAVLFLLDLNRQFHHALRAITEYHGTVGQSSEV